jgi:hypothetical protein
MFHHHVYNNPLPNLTVKRAIHPLFTHEFPGSNLGPETGYKVMNVAAQSDFLPTYFIHKSR